MVYKNSQNGKVQSSFFTLEEPQVIRAVSSGEFEGAAPGPWGLDSFVHVALGIP